VVVECVERLDASLLPRPAQPAQAEYKDVFSLSSWRMERAISGMWTAVGLGLTSIVVKLPKEAICRRSQLENQQCVVHEKDVQSQRA